AQNNRLPHRITHRTATGCGRGGDADGLRPPGRAWTFSRGVGNRSAIYDRGGGLRPDIRCRPLLHPVCQTGVSIRRPGLRRHLPNPGNLALEDFLAADYSPCRPVRSNRFRPGLGPCPLRVWRHHHVCRESNGHNSDHAPSDNDRHGVKPRYCPSSVDASAGWIGDDISLPGNGLSAEMAEPLM
ncbi:uncharacterized protein METZ01_LOCUS328732, partial [marine metagenome]